MPIPNPPTEGQNPWFEARNAFDQAVKTDLEQATANITAILAALGQYTEDPTAGWAGFVQAAHARETTPVVVVTVGSSTTNSASQTEAVRYVSKVATRTQNHYPTSATPAVRTLAAAVSAAPAGAGIHFINAGVSGSDSSDVVTSTTRPQIAALNPAVITWQVGSNDHGNGIPVATFKANITAHLAAFDTLSYTGTHLFLMTYPQFDAGATADAVAPWSAYVQALREIALTRTDMSVLDMSRAFAALDIPGADPKNLIQTDLIHPEDAGHTFIADQFEMKVLGGRGTPEAVPQLSRAMIFSDSFAGAAASLNGRAGNLYAGGSAKSWAETVPGRLVTNGSGRVTNGTGSSSLGYVALTESDVKVSFNTHGNVANNYFLYARRSLTAGSFDGVMIQVVNATAILRQITGGSTANTFGLTAVNFTLGDKLSIEAIGTTPALGLYVNDVLVQTATATVPITQGYAGIATGSASVGINLSNFTIEGPLV